jgi:hypothetical protein
MLAHHPVAGGAGPVGERLAMIAQLGPVDRLVHAVLIAVVFLLLFGAFELCRSLDAGRSLVAAGMAAYACGCACLVGAMLLDGFVTPDVAMRFARMGEGALLAAPPAFAVLSSCIQVLSKAGFCGMGIGMLSWSAACRGREGARVLGLLGVVAGFLPSLFMLFSGLRLNPHYLMMLVGAQGAWNIAASIFLWRRSPTA